MSQPSGAANPILLLILLTWLNVLNFADRTLLGNLAKQISDDPQLDIDYEAIGFLTGYGFIIFYTLIGVGMGALADRWHRPRLIAIGLGIWSALTAATGMARNFLQIAGCRAFIGIGEAALTPSALSMLASVFPPRLHAFASGTYYAGIPLGAGMGMIVSGYLLPNYGWRGCFVILGVVGLLFVLPVLTIKDDRFTRSPAIHKTDRESVSDQIPEDGYEEPARSALTPSRTNQTEVNPYQPTPQAYDRVSDSHQRYLNQRTESGGGAVREFMRILLRSPALICTMLGATFAVYAQSSSIFVLTWLQTERGLSYEYAASWGGWLYLIGGTLGSICGGLASDRFQRRFGPAGRLWFLALVNLVFAPLYVLFYVGDVHAIYFKPLWTITAFGSMVWYGAAFSTVPDLAPARCRATAVACLIFCVNFLGAGPGPWVTGWLGEEQSFTFGLLISVAIGLLALPLNIVAALRYKRDVQLVEPNSSRRSIE